jgi:adenine-specific DNA methylase
MSEQLSFIEKQFPVSKVSKESFKERKAVQSQTLTGLGKWWGRKPLILVRAAILGCLLPATDNPAKDMEIFQKLLMLDKEGLWSRKQKAIPASELYEIASKDKKLSRYLEEWFEEQDGKIKISQDADKSEVEKKVFASLGYDDKLKYCLRPEEVANISSDAWNDINNYCGTTAKTIGEFVAQMSEKRYGHRITVGDCFTGGGSIPFEAARVGANAFASDLNPIATLLSWADLNIFPDLHAGNETIYAYQDKLLSKVAKKIDDLQIEMNEDGDRASAFIYCTETTCPECGYKVPLSSSWIIGKGSKTVAILQDNNDQTFSIDIKMNASSADMKTAEEGTLSSKGMICPHCGKSTPISSIRHDRVDDAGNTIYGLRKWKRSEFEFSKSDNLSDRLYCIRYEKPNGERYYVAPTASDLDRENKVRDIIADNIKEWQDDGLISSMGIENGFNTDQLIRERGWQYWHQLFNPRQLLTNKLILETILETATNELEYAIGVMVLNKSLDWNSKLCRWGTGQARESMAQTFYNQALNTIWQYGTRGFILLRPVIGVSVGTLNGDFNGERNVDLSDAREVNHICDYWITDPPYADAVNYHELSEFFLAWDRKVFNKAFPEWYTDSKRILAVRGDNDFSNTMIEIYSNLVKHMPDDGMQVVMFTHSDPAVWAQLAIIMWKSGLKVTAAWNIATETEAVGLKSGNYVKGTVLLVLRKQTGDDIAFLDEINADIRNEVKNQIESMQKLDDKEEPNFADPDYVLAAYAASLKVLTSYASIEDLDLDYELNQAISNPTKSKVVTIIENAKKIAYDCVIPLEFDNYLWRELTNAEKFYIKGLESEKHGDYQIGTYQEFARGFSIGGYGQMMASEKANTARLKTPVEMAGRTIREVPDFEHSVMRTVFEGIYVGVKEENNPNKALGFIKSDMDNYWDKREMIQQILKFLIDIKYISNMQEHWGESSEMAELLLTLVAHDSV